MVINVVVDGAAVVQGMVCVTKELCSPPTLTVRYADCLFICQCGYRKNRIVGG